jgi:hypothetical protein
MGKRELLIAAAFILIAGIAYQLTAPAPKAGEEGFSLRRIFGELRREINSDAARTEFKQAGTVAVRPELEEIRINTRSIPVVVEGEDRTDIAYEMPVQSTGEDADKALSYAKRSAVETDDLGRQMTFTTYFPDEGSQTAKLTIRVPARLAVRIESGRPTVRGVAAVRLSRVGGVSRTSGAR